MAIKELVSSFMLLICLFLPRLADAQELSLGGSCPPFPTVKNFQLEKVFLYNYGKYTFEV